MYRIGVLASTASSCMLMLVSLVGADMVDFGGSNVRELQNNNYATWSDITFTDDFGKTAYITLGIVNGGHPSTFSNIDSRDSNTSAVTDAKYTAKRVDAPNDAVIEFRSETFNSHSYSNWDAYSQVVFYDASGAPIAIDGLKIRAAHVKATDWIDWNVDWAEGDGHAEVVGNTEQDSLGNQQRLWSGSNPLVDGVFVKGTSFRFDDNATPDQKTEQGKNAHRDVFIRLPDGVTSVAIQQLIHDMGNKNRNWGGEGLRLDFSGARIRSAVPEPSAFISTAVVCIGLAFRTRRRR